MVQLIQYLRSDRETAPLKMKAVNSSFRSKIFPLIPARWFRCRFKIVAGAALLAMTSYISFRLLPPVISAAFDEEPLLWFPDRDISKESLYAMRTFNKPYKYLINPKHVCPTGVPIDYLFVAFSAVEYFRARSVIRRTWGKDVRMSSGNRLIFIFGKPSSANQQSALEFESLQHGDIVQEDFRDSYLNLTLKTVMMLRWATFHCPQARFVVKIDDDTFPNLGNFYRAMHGQAEDAIYGHLGHKQKPSRDPQDKWYIPYNEHPAGVHPDFITGGMYVIGGRVVDLLYRATGHVKPFRMEDIYLTGMCAELTGITRTHLVGTNNLKLLSLCDYKWAIYGHQVTPEEMNDLWYAMKRLEYRCHRILFSVRVCYCRTANSHTEIESDNAVM